jgi:hypothetical protein
MNTKEKVGTKLMQDDDAGKRLHNLKRRRAMVRGNITTFVTEVGKSDTTTHKVYEYYKDRLRETFGLLTSLNDEIHKLLDDNEYDGDLQKSEESIEFARRAILRTSHQTEGI